ncbi:ribonuclease P protein component [bacterium]|nr:ribonuclease P protein component [bacterium]
MKKAARVRKSEEFSRIMQAGRHFSSAYLSIFYLPAPIIKIGITSKKCKTAVQRNYLKRIGRELARANPALWSLKANLIIVVKQTASGITFQSLKSDFDRLIAKISQTEGL